VIQLPMQSITNLTSENIMSADSDMHEIMT